MTVKKALKRYYKAVVAYENEMTEATWIEVLDAKELCEQLGLNL